MKRILLFFVAVAVNNTSLLSQCTNLSIATPGTNLVSANQVGDGIAVAYNPILNLYYTGSGAGPAMNIVTYNNSGVELNVGFNCNWDFRGLWWNPNLGTLESNQFCGGVNRFNLNSNGYALNTSTSLLGSNQPNCQSKGTYDYVANEILYYDNGLIYRINHTTGTTIANYPITGLPVSVGNLDPYFLGYTGCPGKELVVYDLALLKAYFIDKTTGAYVATTNLPASVAGVQWYDLNYAHGQMFFRIGSGTTWYGYNLFGSSNAEINITGNGNSILDGDNTPSLSDNTNFGSTECGTPLVKIFNISNLGIDPLTLNGAPTIVLSGPNAGDYAVTASPAASILPGGNTTFEITFSSSTLGIKTATISIMSNDSDESLYNFDIEATINDLSSPVMNVASLPDIMASCQVSSLTSPTANDLCAGTITGTHNAALPITSQGTTVVTWTYDDGNGNTATQTQNVVIDDIAAPLPTIATLTDVTGECSVASLTAPIASDNCAGIITGTHNATLPITSQGTTVVTWTYDDGNGNTVTQTQNVVINDITAPVPTITILSDVTAECSVASLTSPIASDNCVGIITGTHNATLPITSQGTTVVTWTYDDGNGNAVTQTQNVVINDITAPVPTIAALSDVTGECSVASLTAPTASDNCAGIMTAVHNATLPITSQGTTVVTWTYDDGNGNTLTQTQNVVINDLTGPTPVIANLPNVEATCQVNSLNVPSAIDNCSSTVNVSNDAVLPILADANVTWTYTDENGNISTQIQQVNILGVDASVTLNGSTILANNTNTGVTYQWIDCDNGNQPISGASGVSYTPSVTGNYAVEVTEGGCTDVSPCNLIDFNGLSQLTADFIYVYPNPASSTLSIETSVGGLIDFYDVTGKLIISQKVKIGITLMDSSNFSIGTYFLRLTSEKAVKTVQLVINR